MFVTGHAAILFVKNLTIQEVQSRISSKSPPPLQKEKRGDLFKISLNPSFAKRGAKPANIQFTMLLNFTYD